ncbi:hypothetical protein BLNAU_6850 [Blattamonas nauphoetae]|uniref:Uncharacterized protein n=1 Tax=Blattamonas nauphoetae TaxID=2049346 RepID=A0ABQ9Y335_9EUKA|nr:hypothetical protein BLNAU_6850 [Blattamonas nauphoetae]
MVASLSSLRRHSRAAPFWKTMRSSLTRRPPAARKMQRRVDPPPRPSDLSSPQFPFSMDCSPFLNWKEETFESEDDQAVVFRSLVATVKLQAKLDVSLEAKAVHFLESVHPEDKQSVDAFLRGLASISDNSLASFTQSIGVLFSTPSLTIIKAAMKMLVNLIWRCSEKVRLGLVKADLNPQIIFTLHPLSLSFTEAVNIHTYLISTITFSFRLATQDGLEDLGIEDGNEQQSVHETVLKQVLVPLETYIWHLCVNRFSIIDGDQSHTSWFGLAERLGFSLANLARWSPISPSHSPPQSHARPARLWKAMRQLGTLCACYSPPTLSHPTFWISLAHQLTLLESDDDSAGRFASPCIDWTSVSGPFQPFLGTTDHCVEEHQCSRKDNPHVAFSPEPSLAAQAQPTIWTKTIDIDGAEGDLLFVCVGLSETDQSMLTIDLIILASESSPDKNFVFTTPFSLPASSFPKNTIGVAACTVDVEDGIVNMGGLDGDELRQFWTYWKVSEPALDSSDAKYEVGGRCSCLEVVCRKGFE